MLTPAGEQMFAETFPAHGDPLRDRFSTLSLEDMDQSRASLHLLSQLFS